MVHPQKNWLMHFIIDRYIRFSVQHYFHQIVFSPVKVDPDKSVLLIANHFSLWDGLLLYWLTHKSLNKKFHVMILEETALKEPMLKYAGAFSVNKGSKSIIESINYAAELLADPKNLVLIFPQGKIHSNFADDIKFEKGALNIMAKAAGKFNLWYAATFVENFRYKKPVANVYLACAAATQFENTEMLQSDYQQHYNSARLQQTLIVF